MIMKTIAKLIVSTALVASCFGAALAEPYENGLNAAAVNDYGLAVYWFNQAAQQGDTNAQFKLGVIYINGKTDDENARSKGVNWMRRAANSGHLPAQKDMYSLYTMGPEYGVTAIEAKLFLHKAAWQGDADSEYKLGLSLEAENKPQSALGWYERAAAQGHVEAADKLKTVQIPNRILSPLPKSIYQQDPKLAPENLYSEGKISDMLSPEQLLNAAKTPPQSEPKP